MFKKLEVQQQSRLFRAIQTKNIVKRALKRAILRRQRNTRLCMELLVRREQAQNYL